MTIVPNEVVHCAILSNATCLKLSKFVSLDQQWTFDYRKPLKTFQEVSTVGNALEQNQRGRECRLIT